MDHYVFAVAAPRRSSDGTVTLGILCHGDVIPAHSRRRGHPDTRGLMALFKREEESGSRLMTDNRCWQFRYRASFIRLPPAINNLVGDFAWRLTASRRKTHDSYTAGWILPYGHDTGVSSY